jgi:hypothetical protein
MSDIVRVRVRAAPRIGARMPGWVLRAVVGIIGVGLCIWQIPVTAGAFWLVVAIIIVALSVIFPASPAAWILMLTVGASIFTRAPSPADPRLYVLVAGVHLLHLAASYARVIPPRSWVQLRAFARPMRRYLLVQIPTQLATVIALFAFSPRTAGHPAPLPAGAVVAASALAVLTVVLIAPLIRAKSHDVRSGHPR